MANYISNSICFTICGLENIAQAIVLADSLKALEYDFFIVCKGLENELEKLPTGYNYIDLDDIVQSYDQEVRKPNKYSRFEDIVSYKALISLYFKRFFSETQKFFFFDTDIFVYSKLEEAEELLEKSSFVITPHFTNPIEGTEKISELDINNTGLYNSGFFGFNQSDESTSILKWLNSRYEQYCKVDFTAGKFVDQIWFNFLPLYFKKVFVLKNKGYNMAYWNLHERSLKERDGVWLVNSEQPLVFFHFSGLRLHRPDLISIHQLRYSFLNKNELKNLFKDYHFKWNTKKDSLPFYEPKNIRRVLSCLIRW